jgi:hypothetical protein
MAGLDPAIFFVRTHRRSAREEDGRIKSGHDDTSGPRPITPGLGPGVMAWRCYLIHSAAAAVPA